MRWVMALHEQITQSLLDVRGLAGDTPQTASWSADGSATIEIDFTAVDTLSCAFREIRVSADEFRAASFESLKAWAEAICRKVTYLLEHIGPLELDPQAQTVLVRSHPPTKEPACISFYEMQVQSPGVVRLRRYTRDPQSDDRQQVDVQVTHEALQKLVRDVVEAIPALAQP